MIFDIRASQEQDLPFLMEVRNDEASARHSRSGVITMEQIRKDYFEEKESYIAELGERRAGYLIYNLGERSTEISVALHPDFRKRGLGSVIIDEGSEFCLKNFRLNSMLAVIHKDNIASRKSFEKAGYQLESEDGKFLNYYKKRYES